MSKSSSSLDSRENLIRATKLSPTQRETLTYMAQGHKIYSSNQGRAWLHGVSPGEHDPLRDRGYKIVYGQTLWALIRRGLVKRADTEETPWWRRDYEITEVGRAALEGESA